MLQLHPSTAYHPTPIAQLEISNNAVEQYVQHFTQYYQDDWEALLPMAELA